MNGCMQVRTIREQSYNENSANTIARMTTATFSLAFCSYIITSNLQKKFSFWIRELTFLHVSRPSQYALLLTQHLKYEIESGHTASLFKWSCKSFAALNIIVGIEI